MRLCELNKLIQSIHNTQWTKITVFGGQSMARVYGCRSRRIHTDRLERCACWIVVGPPPIIDRKPGIALTVHTAVLWLIRKDRLGRRQLLWWRLPHGPHRIATTIDLIFFGERRRIADIKFVVGLSNNEIDSPG